MKLKTVLNTPMEDIKPCLECGKRHTRRKFCSPYCGSKYSAKNKRLEMGVNDPKFATSNINAIIKGRDTPIVDNSYNFIFSNKLEDWLGSNNKLRREKWRDNKRKQKERKEAQHKLNTNEDG